MICLENKTFYKNFYKNNFFFVEQTLGHNTNYLLILKEWITDIYWPVKTFNFCNTIQKYINFYKIFEFFFFFLSFPPLLFKCFIWNINNLAFFSLYVVTGYLCSYSSVSGLTDWIEQSPKSLLLISWNLWFIGRFAILFCHPCALQMVRYYGSETLKKGQTSLFWQEGMLTLIVRRFRVETSFLRTVLSQWILM